MSRPAARAALVGLALLAAPALADDAAVRDAQSFLDLYNSVYTSLYAVDAEANWAGATDVKPENEGRRAGADGMWAAFVGDPQVIATTKRLLSQKGALQPLQVKQLETILLEAGAYPGTMPDVVAARVAAEARAAGVQDAFVFCFEPRAADGTCPNPRTANDIDDALQNETDLAKRQRIWEASKEIGRPLKPELVQLQKLRNQVAREMGYSSFFGLQVAEYGMTSEEMIALLDSVATDVAPLYADVQTWATKQLAKKYGQAPPAGPVPAHWYPNRWAQEWGGLVEGVDLDPYFKDRSPEWMVTTAEDFYVSMGFPKLPPVFWEKSDLYPVPAGQVRKKNSHASAWHMDLKNDIRSLMSVQPDAQWFFTSHHELGHIYYYTSYTRPDVPPVLRRGANRAFHEAVGELITVAAGQVPYLQGRGILPPKLKVDPTKAMLEEALSHTIAFVPWSAGVMTHFEYELYEKDLPPEQWQARWWAMVKQYQGVVPPTDRSDPALCDACTKTHIIDDPGGYYDYAIATVIKYQLHEHIATEILKQDPRSCDYYGNKQVGEYLRGILAKGATEDWRKVLKDATGEDLSTRAMVDYYKPLQGWLQKENKRKK